MTVTLFEVGGCVRDELLNLPTKDIDFTAVVTEHYGDPFAHLRTYLNWNNFEIFVETPQFLTIRARFPKGLSSWGGRDVTGLTADFVLARKDGQYTDGRRPDTVEAGTLEEDLARRDFTINAMAKDSAGKLIDLFGGQEDLALRRIRCVGSPEERFREDALRALRAIRFAITKGMGLDGSVVDALRSEWLAPMVGRVSVERRSQELLRAFKHDTMATLEMLQQFPDLTEATLSDGLWLMPTLKS